MGVSTALLRRYYQFCSHDHIFVVYIPNRYQVPIYILHKGTIGRRFLSPQYLHCQLLNCKLTVYDYCFLQLMKLWCPNKHLMAINLIDQNKGKCFHTSHLKQYLLIFLMTKTWLTTKTSYFLSINIRHGCQNDIF